MRKTLIPIIIILVFLFVGLPQVFFVIDEREVAIVTRFGAFQKEYTEPGLKVKTPIIDNVQRFDKRFRSRHIFSSSNSSFYRTYRQRRK